MSTNGFGTCEHGVVTRIKLGGVTTQHFCPLCAGEDPIVRRAALAYLDSDAATATASDVELIQLADVLGVPTQDVDGIKGRPAVKAKSTKATA